MSSTDYAAPRFSILPFISVLPVRNCANARTASGFAVIRDAVTSQRGDTLCLHQQVRAVPKLCKSTELRRGTWPARSSPFVRCGSV